MKKDQHADCFDNSKETNLTRRNSNTDNGRHTWLGTNVVGPKQSNAIQKDMGKMETMERPKTNANIERKTRALGNAIGAGMTGTTATRGNATPVIPVNGRGDDKPVKRLQRQ